MPDNNNNNDDLQNRLAVLEAQLNLTNRNDTNVTDNLGGYNSTINWKALYKLLESEVEQLIFDPNSPEFVKTWARNLIEKLRTRVSPRDLL